MGRNSLRRSAALRKISPRDVTGPGDGLPLAGYVKYYPTFQNRLLASTELIRLIVDNHDVSKHRQSSFRGGTLRNDSPLGFFEIRGLPVGDLRRPLITPMQEVIVPKEPKLPMEARPNHADSWTKLETIISDFRTFIETAIACAGADVRGTIELSE